MVNKNNTNDTDDDDVDDDDGDDDDGSDGSNNAHIFIGVAVGIGGDNTYPPVTPGSCRGYVTNTVKQQVCY